MPALRKVKQRIITTVIVNFVQKKYGKPIAAAVIVVLTLLGFAVEVPTWSTQILG